MKQGFFSQENLGGVKDEEFLEELRRVNEVNKRKNEILEKETTVRDFVFRMWVINQKKMYDIFSINFGLGGCPLIITAPKDYLNITTTPYVVGKDCILMRGSCYVDINKRQIFEGDILSFRLDDNEPINVLCKFNGKSGCLTTKIKEGWMVDINGFYFLTEKGKRCLPIIDNFIGKHDTQLMKIVGNIYENPELFEFTKCASQDLIGYKAPYDIFNGLIKEGDILKDFGATGYGVSDVSTKRLPKEIVENWEPVYEQQTEVEMIK